jgi:hypothetical protein
MRAAISAVWPAIRPLVSNLLLQRNCQIISELSMLRTTSLIISHIDADCQVVTRHGRLTFTFSSCLKYSHMIPECQWSTIPFTSVGSVEFAACSVTLKMCLLTARRRISCKPLLLSRRLSLPLPLPNPLHWRRPESRNGRREAILVLMRTVRRYTSNSAV